jgi:hypothetical protein
LKEFLNGAKVNKFFNKKKDFQVKGNDITFKVDLTFTEEFLQLTITSPASTYPKGSKTKNFSNLGKYFVVVGSHKKEFECEDLVSALMATFQFCEGERFQKTNFLTQTLQGLCFRESRDSNTKRFNATNFS